MLFLLLFFSLWTSYLFFPQDTNIRSLWQGIKMPSHFSLFLETEICSVCGGCWSPKIRYSLVICYFLLETPTQNITEYVNQKLDIEFWTLTHWPMPQILSTSVFPWLFYAHWKSESESHSVVSDSLWPHRLYSPWNSPGQNTGVGSLSLLQGIFPAQGSNPGLPHCRWLLYQLSHRGSPRILEWVS